MRPIVIIIASQWLVAHADDAISTSSPPTNVIPHQADIVTQHDASPDAARFTTESQWEVAGYNSEEIIYTITISSQDSRILRCRTQMQGHYLDKGKLVEIADQQTSTVFPDQQVRVGNWTGLDEKAGANFTVRCRPM
jgi:hypothetical protein